MNKLFTINDTETLDSFLSENILLIFDVWFLSDFDEIKLSSSKINSFYANSSKLIKSLDFSRNYNSAFILMLANFFERFDYSASFDSIIKLCIKKGIPISSRLQASYLFLQKKTYQQEYLDIYDKILCLLDKAHKNEEDDSFMITYTFSNYIHKVINDTHQYNIAIALRLQEKVKMSKCENLYYFLEHSIIDYLININLYSYCEQDSDYLQKYISNCIRKGKTLSKNIIATPFLIEEDTLYSESLKNIDINFKSIRHISVQKSTNIQNENLVRNSLGRGTSVLTIEEQLYLYFRNYGNMHQAKLVSALQTTLNIFNNKSIEVIDWGCGQGLASVVFFDFLSTHKINTNIFQVILIEPSEICLKRAALHVVKYNICNKIKTINKYIDDITDLDITTNLENIKIHLFSNILDVEKFSIEKLFSLIAQSQNGENYFICISPFIDVLKATRLDRFYNLFNSKFDTNLISKRQNSKHGEYWNCNYKYNHDHECTSHPNCTSEDSNKNRWTRYENVFRVEI